MSLYNLNKNTNDNNKINTNVKCSMNSDGLINKDITMDNYVSFKFRTKRQIIC